MGQRGPLIWDGHLYGLCFILGEYAVTLRGVQAEMKMTTREREEKKKCKVKKRRAEREGTSGR